MTTNAPANPLGNLLAEHVRRPFSELPRALAGEEAAVHRLRVACRRLRVALPLLARKGRARRLTRARRVLRRLTRIVGRVRDMDVLVALLAGRMAGLERTTPAQRLLLGRLRAARAQSRARLAEELFDVDIDGLRRGLRRLVLQGAAESGAVLARLAEAREAEAAALLRGWSRLGERFRPGALHALRRRVRRLRYAAELEGLVRDEDSRAPTLWKRLQDAIGTLHDRHMLSCWLDAQARAASERGAISLLRAARGEERWFAGEARRLHRALLDARPSDLSLRALEAATRPAARARQAAPHD